MIPLIAVAGPTASGKTALAVQIALRYGGEVVSCDSMQIYRGMDIGTAKPAPEERRGVPHHLIDIVGPDEEFSVARYKTEADRVIRAIYTRGHIPVLAGGTGLYMRAVVDNIRFAETKKDEKFRQELRAAAQAEGGEKLLETLRKIDPKTAERLHPHDISRIIRALEVYHTDKITISRAAELSRAEPSDYKTCMIGLFYSQREQLYQKIEERVDKMLQAGLEHEVRALLEAGVSKNATSMQAIGYKELAAYIRGEETLAQAAENIKKGTRHYAKRQLTWFRRDERIEWIDLSVPQAADEENILQLACRIIDKSGVI